MKPKTPHPQNPYQHHPATQTSYQHPSATPHHPTTPPISILAQGAEAKIILTGNTIIKNRIKKSYRLTQLDEKLRKQRTKSEAKLLEKAGKIINCPKVINQDKFSIEIEYLNGERLSETLNNKPEKQQFEIMNQIGKQVALLHNADIIHGDLTTSNMILIKTDKINKKENIFSSTSCSAKLTNNKTTANEHHKSHEVLSSVEQSKAEYKIYIIDFGLGFISKRIEDKAVDLHLIKQALEAKHYQNPNNLFKEFLNSYKWQDADKVLEQLKKVEARGRYKH